MCAVIVSSKVDNRYIFGQKNKSEWLSLVFLQYHFISDFSNKNAKNAICAHPAYVQHTIRNMAHQQKVKEGQWKRARIASTMCLRVGRYMASCTRQTQHNIMARTECQVKFNINIGGDYWMHVMSIGHWMNDDDRAKVSELADDWLKQ